MAGDVETAAHLGAGHAQRPPNRAQPFSIARRPPWQTGDILLFFAPPWLHWK